MKTIQEENNSLMKSFSQKFNEIEFKIFITIGINEKGLKMCLTTETDNKKVIAHLREVANIIENSKRLGDYEN